MIAGIILAAGKGTRMKSSDRNKTSIDFAGKPLIVRAVELLEPVVDQTVVVIGAYADSVTQALTNKKVHYARQTKRLGTGHAAKAGVNKILETKLQPEVVIVGYGDHMMFYTPNILREMILRHQNEGAAVTLISTTHEDPDYLAWGRIIRGADGNVLSIVEQKEATEGQRAIKELNAGFYCFDWQFIRNAIKHLIKSSVAGEYYLTDLIEIANHQSKKVVAHLVPFKHVGYGINTWDHLSESESLFLS